MKVRHLVAGTLLTLSSLHSAHAMKVQANRMLPSSAFAATQEPQEIQIFTNGITGLDKRLQMIASAKKSIETEYFVYKTDATGRIYTEALIEAAARGVKVRLLVDSTPLSREVNEYFSYVMGLYGVEVRFFNDSPLLKLQKAQYRSHRKLLLIDGQEALTGGRNIADEYFGMSAQYNFLDRDIYIKGSMIQPIRNSFESFWNSELSVAYPPVRPPNPGEYGIMDLEAAKHGNWTTDTEIKAYQDYKRDFARYVSELEKARNFTGGLTAQDRVLMDRVRQMAPQLMKSEYKGTCNETYFLADQPGYRAEARVVFDHLKQFTGQAKKNVISESPYVTLTDATLEMFADLRNRGVESELLTNSLYSTDTVPVVASLNSQLKKLTGIGGKVFLYQGESPRWVEPANPQAGAARWGIHAKAMVIDDDTTMIGTFNMDSRSIFINAEMAVVCVGNPELAKFIRADLEKHKGQMALLDENAKRIDGQSKMAGVSSGTMFFYKLAQPFIGLFDFWL